MAITLGPAGTPNTLTLNLDALFSTSLFNYRKTLQDNISNSNAFFYEMKKGNLYESYRGAAIAEDLMYEMTASDWYSGFDTLSTTPPDGITQAIFVPRQMSAPVTYSEEERKKNKLRIVDFVQARIKQTELGIIDTWCKAIWQGSGAGALTTAKVSPATGASGIDPIPLIIDYAPTGARSIGGIPQNTETWWQNRSKVSAATTYTAFLMEMDNMYNQCSRGPGGPPNLIICDQTTHELWRAAYYEKYRRTADEDRDYPFANFLFNKARVVWDENVPNVFASTLDTTTATGGTAYFINTQFMKIRYEEETDFTMGSFLKPVDQDIRVAHIFWMGQITVNNRRKLGVVGAIARTLTA